ncbi:MAG: PorT family protein [Ignavibacteriae bacterium]|nr:PorT family protein [Ignavibacteriota bacterium]NOG98627.1 PorT family protein [Ignavibacteriota bacterium]
MGNYFIRAFTVALFVLLFNNMQAQFRYGIIGGLNIANLSNSYADETFYKNGLVLGAVLDYNINEKTSVRFEPRYTQKGQVNRRIFIDAEAENKIKLNYFELPIYLTYNFTNTKISPYILGGLNFSYLLSAEMESKYLSFFSEQEINTVSNISNKSWDYSLEAGIGFEYKITSKISTLVDIRYSYGLVNNQPGMKNNRTRGIQFLMGYLFAF